MSAKISDDKKASLFKMLATKPMYEAGLEFGLDKHFKTVSGLRNYVSKVYNEVRQDPAKFTVQPDTVELVVSVVTARNPVKTLPGAPSLREKKELEEGRDIKDLVLEGRKKAYRLLNAKMDDIMSSKAKISEANLSTLAQTFGILFDKGQIVKGEATENIAMHAKIDKNISPEDAMALILKSREANLEEKVEVKK